MRLEQIVIQGFKSFAEKTEVQVFPGVTCIVGPNGCGKSNVADAVRWALGEQSPKILRGHKMEDVIFHGSSTRKAVGLAEVGLVFNNDGGLNVPWSEVGVARRLYRTGESEYLLNNGVCRLRDIQDLFAGTGVNPKAYALMDQDRPQPRPDRQALGAADLHRGGGRRRALQAAAGRDPGQARRHPPEPATRPRRHGRGQATGQLARAPSEEGPAVQGAPPGEAGPRLGHAGGRLRRVDRCA
jgi:energy-coupling factor transporter ATP-binding protein EcfA2